ACERYPVGLYGFGRPLWSPAPTLCTPAPEGERDADLSGCGAETGERVAHGARHAARRGRIGAEARGDGAVELIVHDLPLADLAVGARAPALRVGRVAARCDTHREACTAEVEVTDEAAVLAGRARPVALRKLQ